MPKHIRSILCAVDFSKSSIGAFETAAQLAQAFNAALHVIHVVEGRPLTPDPVPITNPSEAASSLESEASDALQTLVAREEKALKGVELTTEINAGDAAPEILNRADELRVDLIVLGARGQDLPTEAFAGSTAERITKGARCSVLLARK
jgi:nucleotide-binding universal stress UspA family protein